jgi:carboxyl-terminal processing protease
MPRNTILDLRFNPGGDVMASIDAASIFVPRGKRIAALVGRQVSPQEYFADESQEKFKGSVTILISKNTASAAETFVRAVARYRPTKLVGQSTHGKCSSQALINLAGGDKLLVSAFRILDADMKDCGNKGVRPALEINGRELLMTERLLMLARQRR